MAEIVSFLPEHIQPALTLWRATDHIGRNDVDDHPDKLFDFLQRNAGHSFVALAQGRLVGTCLCGHDLRRATIYHLAVDSSLRRGGIGKSLVEASLTALQKTGITKCQAFVFSDNPYSEWFWKKEGWVLRQDLSMFSRPI